MVVKHKTPYKKLHRFAQGIVLLLLYPFLNGFVLLSGPEEARLPVSPSSPTIMFLLNPKHPEFDQKEDFLGGAYKDLDDDAFYETLVRETMDIWNRVEGSYVRLDVTVDASAVKEGEDGIFSIVPGNLPPTAAAAAHPQFKHGSIYDCDIQIGQSKTSARDLAFTILHELGHCLGLGHNHSNYGAVMGYARKSRGLYLAADDKAGLIYLYRDPTTPEPQEAIACGRIPGRGGSPWALLLIVLPLVVTVIRRWGRGF